MTPHIYLCLIWDTGDHELHAKEHRWLQHWKHFTWLSWRGDKLCSNGSAIYRPKCVLFHVPSMLVESGFMHDANLILLSLPDSWVNFYGNIGKTLLSLVWNISSILDNSSTLCKFLTVTNLMLVVWFYHYCQIICCPSKPVLSFTFHLNSSLLPSALVLMDTFCRCPYSLTLYSCVNTISCILRTKLFLSNSTRREQSHLSGFLRSQLRQKMCKVKLI